MTHPTTPSKYDTYASPLAERNASPAMLRLWSPRHKFNTWRRIWLAVAEAQHEITRDWGAGVAASGGGSAPLVTQEQVEELRAVVERGITDDEIRLAEKYERELRHDVMAHVHALGEACPKAKGIIHLGMTSQDVVCNADHKVLSASISLIFTKMLRVVIGLSDWADRLKDVPTLAYTHYQPAQPTTVGRRFALWAHDLSLCYERIEGFVRMHRAKGAKGATGTQASFMHLFSRIERPPFSVRTRESDSDRVSQSAAFAIECQNTSWPRVAEEETDSWLTGYEFYVSGQTYPRVIDTFILADLASVASVLHKIATDIRLLCNRKELDEPFEDKQIGSSAMPYKRNPMRCERICGLTRFVMNLVGNAYDTAATQWLERTLDDSSNRRLSLPEAFLALDGALDLMHNVASGLIVHEAMVKKNLMAELPFMATENILMACVKLGGDRQHYHELIRVHAQAAGLRVKQEGLDNDLLERLKNDKNFWSTKRGGPLREELDWDGLMDPMKYIGRSVEQTERFIKEVIEPLREQYGEAIAKLDESGPRV